MKYNEILNEHYRDLTHQVDNGSIEGYEVSTGDENYQNWLVSEVGREKAKFFIDRIIARYTKVAVLKNLYVDEEHRGEGIGNDLMDTFINSTDGIILLAADKYEDQAEGFDLVRWYEGWGFHIIDKDGSSGPLMANMDL